MDVFIKIYQIKNYQRKYLIDVKEDGSFKMNMDYFNYCVGLTMTSSKFHKLFGGPPRKPESKLTQKEMDLARSVQAVTEEVVLKIAKHVKKQTGMKYLCLAGGVALNCVANGKLLRSGLFDDIWIQPAAGDAGGALGAALAIWHKELKQERLKPIKDNMNGSYLGPSFSNDEIHDKLTALRATFEKFSEEDLLKITAEELSN